MRRRSERRDAGGHVSTHAAGLEAVARRLRADARRGLFVRGAAARLARLRPECASRPDRPAYAGSFCGRSPIRSSRCSSSPRRRGCARRADRGGRDRRSSSSSTRCSGSQEAGAERAVARPPRPFRRTADVIRGGHEGELAGRGRRARRPARAARGRPGCSRRTHRRGGRPRRRRVDADRRVGPGREARALPADAALGDGRRWSSPARR